jgi:hypothetical protein
MLYPTLHEVNLGHRLRIVPHPPGRTPESFVHMTDSDLYGEIRTAQPALHWRVAISAEFHRIEETCAGGARGQSDTARLWRIVNLWLGAAAVLTSGVAGSLVLATGGLGPIAGGLAMIAALLTTILGLVGPARRENQAAEAAKAFQTTQTLSRQARQVDLPGQPFDQARKALAELTERWHGVNRAAVPVPNCVQRRAEHVTGADGTDEAVLDQMGSLVSVFRVSPSL